MRSYLVNLGNLNWRYNSIYVPYSGYKKKPCHLPKNVVISSTEMNEFSFLRFPNEGRIYRNRVATRSFEVRSGSNLTKLHNFQLNNTAN